MKNSLQEPNCVCEDLLENGLQRDMGNSWNAGYVLYLGGDGFMEVYVYVNLTDCM